MSDLDVNKKTGTSRNQKNTTEQNRVNQATGGSPEKKEHAGEASSASSSSAQGILQGAAETAKDFASEAQQKLEDQAQKQQQTGAELVNKFAGNIRQAARAFEKDVPFAAQGINSVADYVEEAAEKIRQGSFRDLVDSATTYARQRPAAFLGVTVLAGFAVVRFLKAGQSPSPAQNTTRGPSSSTSTARTSDSGNRSSHSGQGYGGIDPAQGSYSQSAKRDQMTPGFDRGGS
jgi:ElaB/YqjD/DUF883 family membrane-anchored ribosome-binding protein